MYPEAVYAHALNCIAEFSPKRLVDLYNHFGSYETAWHAPAHDLGHALQNPELGEVLHKNREHAQLETQQKQLEELHITPIMKEDSAYPEQLQHIPLPPTLLYMKGALLPANTKTIVAVVGTRMATSYGREACRTLVEPLAKAGIPIISGLAAGIDTEAHKTTLAAKGYTAAVLGSGIDRGVLYPSSNKRLADEIVANGGALISEYPPHFKASTWTFPLRNRIIAGLSSAVLVIEAREKSGTLITARHALELGRDVMAVPGSIFSTTSKTPHALIRDGATPVTSPEDIFHALGFSDTYLSEQVTHDVSLEEQAVLDTLVEPRSANDIGRMLEKRISDIQRILALLEIHGTVRNMGNGIYRKT
ncbi:MAG: DNA protecting protein DprA [Candidatus Ryanbacteria bacterium RIFCSPHIGHO2_01_FULL_48_27]|uniref:DNA protecting protein DprA n=1 Tax=Candidatus Ryanbacteria bacterium RIFCSPHIGHO2_01_FULL_48_27 TaxID=1802115 RepID=A0A1G2G493_9BACT|nr:MAG: DNA protecting protein DprA [Candidatus Ryanbacteria bacterium RIFCSPHIGHO2_01_FULL_48_27]